MLIYSAFIKVSDKIKKFDSIIYSYRFYGLFIRINLSDLTKSLIFQPQFIIIWTKKDTDREV